MFVHKNIQTTLANITAAILIGVTAIHIFLVNSSLPFMTVDELAFLLSDFSTNLGVASSSGRVSILFGYVTTKFLSFSVPTVFALLPRFFSIIFLYSTIVLYLRGVFNSWLYAIGIASIIIAGHIVDWQHNGMVAFFGDYNIYLGAYLLAIVSVKSVNERFFYPFFFSAVLLLLLSFASEFFFGLAALHLTLYVGKDKGLKERSYPFLVAVAIYIVAFILFRFIVRTDSTVVTSSSMANYLYGNLSGSYSIADMIKGGLLYAIYSLPVPAFRASLNSFNLFKVFLYLFCFVTLSIVLTAGVSKSELNSNFKATEFFLLSVMLILAPNLLIALQPLKLKWILTGASNRYVFSYYAWIGYVLIGALALYYLSKYNRMLILPFVIMISPILVNAMELSRSFVAEYSDSLVKWRQLGSLLSAHRHADVSVDEKFFEHPYISVIPEGYLPAYAKKFYDAKIQTIFDPVLGIEFADYSRYPPSIKAVTGVSGHEAQGRWTEGAVAAFTFAKNLPSTFRLSIDVAAAFRPNEGRPVMIKVGDWHGQFAAAPGHVNFFVKTAEPTDTLEIIVPKPTSPRELGISDDPRLLGIMLKRIELTPLERDTLVVACCREKRHRKYDGPAR